MPPPTEMERIRAVLDEVVRQLPAWPKVVGVEFEEGVDGAGDPAVYITVLLDESTRSEDWTNPNFQPIIDAIRLGLQEAAINRWPYVGFARPSDWRAAS